MKPPRTGQDYQRQPLGLETLLGGKPASDLHRSTLGGLRAGGLNLAAGAVLATPPATASHPNLWLWGGLALLVVGLYQLAACWLWPFKNHRRCGGSGKLPALFGGSGFRTCPGCGGSGKRVRVGRRFVDQFREVRSRAK